MRISRPNLYGEQYTSAVLISLVFVIMLVHHFAFSLAISAAMDISLDFIQAPSAVFCKGNLGQSSLSEKMLIVDLGIFLISTMHISHLLLFKFYTSKILIIIYIIVAICAVFLVSLDMSLLSLCS